MQQEQKKMENKNGALGFFTIRISMTQNGDISEYKEKRNTFCTLHHMRCAVHACSHHTLIVDDVQQVSTHTCARVHMHGALSLDLCTNNYNKRALVVLFFVCALFSCYLNCVHNFMFIGLANRKLSRCALINY